VAAQPSSMPKGVNLGLKERRGRQKGTLNIIGVFMRESQRSRSQP
jgi:hypothetical protein